MYSLESPQIKFSGFLFPRGQNARDLRHPPILQKHEKIGPESLREERLMKTLTIASTLLFASSTAAAQSCYDMSPAHEARSLSTHMFGGNPSDGGIMIRRAYVTEYNETYRVPRWAAWHAEQSYRATPIRSEGSWGSFYRDTSVDDPVVTRDYTGLYYGADNFARGHIVPYFISGGDRDFDGALAAGQDRIERDDPYDACTVREVNYMTNITPQYHERFNGSPSGQGATPGLWYQLETIIRSEIDAGEEFHIIAGTIFGEDDVQLVGRDGDIGVPDEFFKIVVTQHGPVGFLFSHRRQLHPEACDLDAQLVECIVPISIVEAATGLDFFTAFPDEMEAALEAVDGQTAWSQTVSSP